MSRLAVIAAIVTVALTGPVQAQGTTSTFLVGPSQLNLYQALSAPAYGQVQYGFNPDPNLRGAVVRNVLAGIASSDRDLAAALGNRPFANFGPALAAHDISINRLDDALTFMMIALWDAANASSAETTPGQAAGVKRQAQSLLATLPGGRPAVGSMQEASDSIFLNALTISVLASKVLDGGNPQAMAQLQQMARQESMASFGVDFGALALTESGFRPR